VNTAALHIPPLVGRYAALLGAGGLVALILRGKSWRLGRGVPDAGFSARAGDVVQAQATIHQSLSRAIANARRNATFISTRRILEHEMTELDLTAFQHRIEEVGTWWRLCRGTFAQKKRLPGGWLSSVCCVVVR